MTRLARDSQTPTWKRSWRRLRLAFQRPRARLFWGRRYELEIPGNAFDGRRAVRILAFLHSEGLISPPHVTRVRRVPLQILERVHDPDYLGSLEERESLTAVLGQEVDEPLHDDYLISHREQVSGTVGATRNALSTGRVAVNLGGGFHHATRDRGQGFCVFNDVAVAIEERRRSGFRGNVLIVDLDIHDGDGTRAIYAKDPTVHTLSIHNRELGPTEAVASTSVALGDDVEDGVYLASVREELPRLLESFAPDLIFFLAGADPARDDRLGNWRISGRAMLERDRFVISLCRERSDPLPLVILLSGGYGRDAWRYPARTLSAFIRDGSPIEPPPGTDLLLRRFRRIARGLRSGELTAESDEGWSLTAEDIDPSSTASRQRHRFLGFYSRHGIELALERYGLAEHLRRIGHGDFVVELQFDPSTSDTLRVITAGGERLIELRARRDEQTVPGRTLLDIEWMLLQNPGGEFTSRRPRLPGQRHPGLGLLREFSALLVLICERLELDGMIFTPSHYHIAARGRSYFHFLEPRAQACFVALQRALKGLRLDEAIARMEDGGVIDRRSGSPVAWVPSPMVLPVAADFKELLDSDNYERETLRCLAEFDFVRRD